MKVIAVTGGIGSGKSTVSNEFARLGAKVISADTVAHENMRRGGCAYDEIVKAFEKSVLDEDGEINRKRLADIVFSDSEKLLKLNSVTHKYVYDVIGHRVEKARQDGEKLVCIEIPLLFSAECPIDIDLSIAVVADKDIRIKRTMLRDGCTSRQAEARIGKQISDERLRELADITIENNGDLTELYNRVKMIYESLCQDR